MDHLYAAFSDYIHSHPGFDILYSEKIGYVMLGCYSLKQDIRICSVEQMLYLLTEEILRDILYKPDLLFWQKRELTENEKQEARECIGQYLKRLRNQKQKEQCCQQVEEHLRRFPYYYWNPIVTHI